MNVQDPVVTGPIQTQWVKVFFPTADTPYPVVHKCKGILMECSVARVSDYCRIKESQMPPGSNVVQLVSDTAGVEATIRVVTNSRTVR
jgi:hypothetical protein